MPQISIDKKDLTFENDESRMTLEFFIDWFKSDLDRFKQYFESKKWFEADVEYMSFEEWEDELEMFLLEKKNENE